MILKYLSLALRSIWNNKYHSLVNILGFGVGMAVCIFIMLWVTDELSYDRFHTKSGRIYRILYGEGGKVQPRTPHPLAQQMVQDFAEVEKAVSMSPLWGSGLTRAQFSVSYEDKMFDEKEVFLHWLSDNWLQNFAYRTDIGVLISLVALAVTLAITLLTISFQVWQTSRMDPVESLKYE